MVVNNYNFPLYKQHDQMDCGPACLSMIAKYYGKHYSIQNLRKKCSVTNSGVSLLGISDAAESIHFRTISVKINFGQLIKVTVLPAIVYWNQNHFVVVYKIKKNQIYVADPAIGKIKYNKKEFLKGWYNQEDKKGICLLLEPTEKFYQLKEENKPKANFGSLLSFTKQYKLFFVQLFLSILLASIIQLVFPFLTQALVDYGIKNQSIEFIYLILLAQIVLIISRTLVEFFRSWILLHISTRFNIGFVAAFLFKLMKLPIRFFDTRSIGDILQRIADHRRIEAFLTSAFLNVFYSFLNLLIYGAVLLIYSNKIFTIFLLGSILYVLWIIIFLRKRKELDYKKFSKLSENQNVLIQIVKGIQEIKLNSCEKQKRWEWEELNANLFKINISSLRLEQYQQAGSIFINETKNIFITFLAAKAVIENEFTLGAMLAIQFILGYLNRPLEQILSFIWLWQDAKISFERINEIHDTVDEIPKKNILKNGNVENIDKIIINNLFFSYNNSDNYVLSNINVTIKKGETIAIVGSSGSGKTTLIKLLLAFYKPTSGSIMIGKKNLLEFNYDDWRKKCGVVMQDGYIFSDTIENNISMYDENTDINRINNAINTANLSNFIESLPNGINTKIGVDGQSISQGQKQRILIARVVYKNPEIIFLDEATNSLDAENEKIILKNLNEFFEDKTKIIIAHRLSTVKNADKIIVIEKGKIIEQGTHIELLNIKDRYYNLVKDQLELGE